MKKAILILALVSLGVPSFATDIKRLNEKVDMLEVEHEMQELEEFGEQAELEVAEQETKRVETETRQLKKEISQMEKANARNKKKVSTLTKKFQVKDRIANRTAAKHKKVETVHNRLNTQVDSLQTKVNAAEQKAIDSLKARKSLERNILRLKREQAALKKRLRKAQQIFASNRAKGRRSMKTERALAKQNAQIRAQLDN